MSCAEKEMSEEANQYCSDVQVYLDTYKRRHALGHRGYRYYARQVCGNILIQRWNAIIAPKKIGFRLGTVY